MDAAVTKATECGGTESYSKVILQNRPAVAAGTTNLSAHKHVDEWIVGRAGLGKE